MNVSKPPPCFSLPCLLYQRREITSICRVCPVSLRPTHLLLVCLLVLLWTYKNWTMYHIRQTEGSAAVFKPGCWSLSLSCSRSQAVTSAASSIKFWFCPWKAQIYSVFDNIRDRILQRERAFVTADRAVSVLFSEPQWLKPWVYLTFLKLIGAVFVVQCV